MTITECYKSEFAILLFFTIALDLVRKLRLTQGLDIKEEDEFEESEGKDEIRNKILSIMDQVTHTITNWLYSQIVKIY